MNDSPKNGLVLHPKCILTELPDGTGVVLNLETKFYHTLNATAVTVWKALESGCFEQQELARKLVLEFEIDEASASADVSLLLADLAREGLLIARPISG